MLGKTKKVAAAPSQAADPPRPDTEIAAYIKTILEDGDARAVAAALRTVADAAGLEKAEGIMRRYRRTLRVLAK